MKNEEMINTAVISGIKMVIHFLQLSLLLNNIAQFSLYYRE